MVSRRAAWLLFGSIALGACSGGPAPDRLPQTCRVDPPDRAMACTQEYNPVCGCDGKTYPNACVARASGVPASTPGACAAPPLD